MGFSARELCVIFALNNTNTVYVKCHQLNKKLNKEVVESQTKEK